MSQTIPFFFSIIWNNPTNQGTANLLNLTYEILFPLFSIACIVFLFPGRSKSRFDPDRPVAQLRQWTTGKHRRRYPFGSFGNERQLHRRAVRPGNRKKAGRFSFWTKCKTPFFVSIQPANSDRKSTDRDSSGQEYITADDFIVQDNTLIVFDNNKSQLQFYDFQGNYVKTIPVCQGGQIAVNPAGGYIVYSSVADKYHVHTFNDKGEKTGEYLPVESK